MYNTFQNKKKSETHKGDVPLSGQYPIPNKLKYLINVILNKKLIFSLLC